MRYLLTIAAVLIGFCRWTCAAAPEKDEVTGSAAAASAAELGEARQLFLAGRYVEAKERYHALRELAPIDAACGVADVLCATGHDDRARHLLEGANAQYPNDPRPSAALAVLHFRRGRYAAAERAVQQALASAPNQLAARWIRAELFRTAGELDAANQAYRWFVDYYNAADSNLSAEDLYWIGLAAAEYARWNRLHDQFDLLVNTIYPDAIAADPNFWPAPLAVGRLFMEKFNADAATRELAAARKINPNSAEILTALAELSIRDFDLAKARHLLKRALTIDPNCIDALLLDADIDFVTCEPESAIARLERARTIHPRHEPTLGRLAAAYGLVDGTLLRPIQEILPRNGPGVDLGVATGGEESGPAAPARPADSRLAGILAEVERHNRCPGTFYYEFGLALDKCRQFPVAAACFERAAEVMPQLVGPRAHHGLMRMCLGEEAAARELLDASFEADPFNVRVKNTLAVLDVLAGYEDLTTAHFIIRFDPRHDRVLAKCAARYLERIYPELARQLHYEPAGRTLIELFNRAKNTDGHGWFSARIVGLPRIDTIAACTGNMVAMVAPTSRSDLQVHWARILQHELVHVINFQQTHYNIPHWYTEALAVHFEAQPRSPEWNALLAERVPQGHLFDLRSIHLGFIRPGSNADWQMAYCQAELYAEYMRDRFGDDALVRLLAAYAKTMQTDNAIAACFGIPITDFERGYRDYLQNVTAALALGTQSSPRSMTELKQAHDATPADPECAANLAIAYLARQDLTAAQALIEPMLVTHPNHPRVLYADARRFLAAGDREAAIERLVTCLDESEPDPEVLRMLAGLRYQAGAIAESQRLLQLGATRWPDDVAWTEGLAAIAMQTGPEATLYNLLEQLAARDGDNAKLRKKLALLAAERGDYAAAAHWAEETIHIDVLDSSMHQLAARAYVQLGRYAEAAKTFEICVDLEPDRRDLRLEWAKAWYHAGESGRARKILQPLMDQGDQEAKQLFEEMED